MSNATSSTAPAVPTSAAPDLTKRAPRSMRVRLGGFALLPRILDKCRATLAGTQGEFNYDCPLDQHFLRFAGIDADALTARVARGGGDGEILAWILENSTTQPTPWSIAQWSTYHDQRGPDGDVETLEYFTSAVAKLSRTREDVRSWADLLDLDDHVTFGGQP